MKTELDHEYFLWLCSQVSSVKSRSRARSYRTLLGQLHDKEFVWFVPNDDNRVEDGRQLREEFLDSHGLDGPVPSGCSMLEMLIGIARRLSFLTERKVRGWFWELLRNLGIADLNDAVPYNFEEVDEVLDRVIYRAYSPDGSGGLFPLENAREDQTKVELWYQLNAYLIERY